MRKLAVDYVAEGMRLVLLGAVVAAVALGCSSGPGGEDDIDGGGVDIDGGLGETDGRASERDPVPPVDPVDIGDPDLAADGAVSVDEALVEAEVDSGRLRVRFQVSCEEEEAAEGSLNVSLRSVDGLTTLDSTAVSYDLNAGQSEWLSAEVDMPDDVEQQPDLVRYNLRIDNGDDGALRVTRSLFHLLPAYEVRLEGPATLMRGKKATYRIRAQDPVSLEPKEGMLVQLVVTAKDAADQVLDDSGQVRTGDFGDAVVQVDIPESGDYEVSVKTWDQGTTATVKSAIAVNAPGQKLFLTTDRPIYKPGHTMHLRALVLSQGGNLPVQKQELLFEVEDGKGNKILKKEVLSDEYGIAATTFKLARVLNMGTFKVRVTSDEFSAEKTVEVSQYALPKFRVSITVDKAWYGPGETVNGSLEAAYFFGKPTANAQVSIEALTLDIGENVFQRVVGATDEDGKMNFTVQLPATLAGIPLQQGNALVNLRATVTDTADQAVTQEHALTVAQDGIEVVLVPESTTLVPGLENRLHLFVTNPLGAPVVDAKAELFRNSEAIDSGATDDYGYLQLLWTPDSSSASSTSLAVTVTPTEGDPVTQQFSFGAQSGAEHMIVRTDQTVYEIGETVAVEIHTTGQSANVYVDWLNEGQAVDMRTLEAEDGIAAFTATVDSSLVGSNRIEAYMVNEDGNIQRAGRTVFVRSDGALDVSLDTDKDFYAPGEAAELTFSVTDEQGEPAVAALGVQIVDEAVFALIDARPGLLRTFFELEDMYAQPNYQIAGPQASLVDLLFRDTRSDDPDEAKAAQFCTEATLAAMGATSVTGIQQGSWDSVSQESISVMQEYYDAEAERLREPVGEVAEQLVEALSAMGCPNTEYWCGDQGTTYQEGLTRLLIAAVQLWDFWGNGYREASHQNGLGIALTTDGPDETAGTPDDGVIVLLYDDMGVSLPAYSPPTTNTRQEGQGDMATGAGDPGAPGAAPPPPDQGMGGMGGAGGAAAAVDAGTAAPEDDGEGGGSQEPRVRKDFPETLYVNPALITGADGTATIEVDMADSITEWRVSTLANSADGKLGGGVAGLIVFQDFFTDVNFPATLTRGDRIEFPIAVYNYLEEPQTVSLELEAADWYTPQGATSAMLDLEPNQVIGFSFPVVVDEVGLQTLTVRAYGTDASDAVARTVLVEPDGKAFPDAASGSLAPGQVEHTVSFPVNAIDGSAELYLNIYPAYLSQAVEGMDSMLSEPYGCFEQTTSTTWPNVLVTNYMEQTGQITPEIQMKAESLISTGYQRLLTFEHSGGGFSWFGEQDPEPFLSVTAFGFMEFMDMSQVHNVDQDMIERTRTWLLSQQLADGSWEGDVSEFFSFHTSNLRNTAFVMWSLATGGYQGVELDNALAYIKAHMNDEDTDAYTLGIIANALVLAAPNDATTSEVLAQLDDMKQVDGDKISWDSAGTQTNFYGAGNDAAVATTAIVAHALLLDGGYSSSVNGALEYLVSSKDPNGNFGSTQATVWALRTLLLAAQNGTEGAVGELTVSVDGSPFTTVELTEDQSDVMTTVDLYTLATAGDHDVSLSFSGEGRVSYNLVSSYHLPWAGVPIEPAGPLSVSVAYDRTTLFVDETATCTVTVRNNTPSVQNMVLLTMGIPPGFAVLTEDLGQYMASGILSNFETTGNQLTLYVRQLAAGTTQAFNYRVRATMPVRVADGGAQVYPYYEPDQRSDAESTTIEATAP